MDWAENLDDMKSTIGGVLLKEISRSSVQRSKQQFSAPSTEAEYRVLAHISTEVIWWHSLLKELRFNLTHTPIFWCENNGARSLALNLVFHTRTKHIKVDVYFIRDKVSTGQLNIQYINTEDQLVYLLTKSLAVARLSTLLSKLQVFDHLHFRSIRIVRESVEEDKRLKFGSSYNSEWIVSASKAQNQLTSTSN